MAGNSSGGETTTQTSSPWSGQQPYLQDLFSAAQGYFRQGNPNFGEASQYYNQVAPSAENASAALGPYVQQLLSANQNLAGGNLLDPASNPGFADYLNLSNQAISTQLNEQILPNLDLGAVAAGGFGDTRHGVAQGQSVGKTVDAIERNTAGLTSQAYGQGLQATLQAQQLAPLIAQLQLAPAMALEGAGDAAMRTATLEDDAERQRLLAYQQLIGGNYGGEATTTGPGTKSGGLAGAIGGAASIGSFTENPWAIGAGAIGGYFS